MNLSYDIVGHDVMSYANKLPLSDLITSINS